MTIKIQIDQAVHILKQGGLVAFPTETVYGLGADANNEHALEKIFAVKERPSTHPLIVHLATLEQMADWAVNIPPAALKLAQTFWPGPLTLILEKKPGVLDQITGGQNTVGLRVPSHPIAQALLGHFGQGIAAPSANKFTHVSPTTAQAVQEELGGAVDLILDGGECDVGLESTIIDVINDCPKILRPGMITQQQLEHVIEQPIFFPNHSSSIRVPGMHTLHYAPRTPVTLIETHDLQRLNDLVMEAHSFVMLSYTPDLISPSPKIDMIVMPKDAKNYAHKLYQVLRECDQGEYSRIVVQNVPISPEWTAIHDRLKKASANR